MSFFNKNLSFIFLIIIADQITKIIADNNLTLGVSQKVLSFFDLTLLYNHGAAFSFLSSAGGWQRWLFLILSLVISIILLVWLKRTKPYQKYQDTALILIIGGAIGNLIDRIYLGYVIDFLHFHIGGYYWPSFNIADSSITCGAILLIIISIREPKNS